MENAPLAGFIRGVFVSFTLMSIGTILLFIPIINIFGMLLVIYSIFSLIVLPFKGLTDLKGECPYCKHEVLVESNQKSIKCPHCKEMIIVRDKELYKVDK